MVNPPYDPVEQRRRALLSIINQRRGFIPPPPAPAPALPVGSAKKERKGPGGFLGKLGKGFAIATSGEAAANALLPGDPGTDVRRSIERVPVVGKPLGFAADVATAPATLLTAGAGAQIGAGLRAAGGFGRFLAPVIEPVAGATLGQRLLATTTTELTSRSAQRAAEGAGLPLPLQIAAGAGGGLVGAHTVSNVIKQRARTAGGMTAEEIADALASDDDVRVFSAVLSQGKVQRKELAALRTQEHIRRSAETMEKLAGVDDPIMRRRIIRRGQAGALPDRLLEADFAQITPDRIDRIRRRISDYYSSLGTRGLDQEANATEAFDKLLTGKIPTDYEIGLFEKALGTQFADVVASISSSQDKLQLALEIAGVPRAVMTSFDASMPFRQGAILWSRPSFWRNFKPMVKAMADENYAKHVREQIATDPHPVVEALRRRGVITGLASGRLLGKEEQYMTTLARKMPGVGASERGAVTYLNKLRVDQAKDAYGRWERAALKKGIPIEEFVTDKDIDDLAWLTGLFTGRGDLPGAETALPAVLQSLFFSPRFLASRLQLLNPMTYKSLSPLVRKEAARDLAAYFGLGAAGLSALALAGKAGILPVNVEVDPRSADFARVRIGQTRIDPWAGFQPIARYAAQLVTEQSKSSTGETRKRARAITLENFARSKLSPIPSFLVDALQGTSFVGKEVDVVTGQGLDRAAAERLVPMFIQDLAEAIAEDGVKGALLTAPAAVGFGVQTYRSVAAIQQVGAQELYNKPWSKLTGQEKAKVREAYADKLAKLSSPGDDTVAGFIEREDDEMRAFEQRAVEALRRGDIKNADFTKGMQDRLKTRNDRLQAIIDYTSKGVRSSEDVLDKYYALYDQATIAGKVDYQLLDQLQANFLEELSPEDRRIVEERTAFVHAPEVQWWVDARNVIKDSGYYKAQDKAMRVLQPLLNRVGAGGLTYNQLVARINSAETVEEALILDSVRKRIDRITKQQQTLMRAKNPALDAALTAVYGSTPLALRRR